MTGLIGRVWKRCKTLELTGTNKPKTSTHTTWFQRIHAWVFAFTMWLTTNNPSPGMTGCGCVWLVVEYVVSGTFLVFTGPVPRRGWVGGVGWCDTGTSYRFPPALVGGG